MDDEDTQAPPGALETLQKLAADRGMTPSEAVRRQLEWELYRYPSNRFQRWICGVIQRFRGRRQDG